MLVDEFSLSCTFAFTICWASGLPRKVDWNVLINLIMNALAFSYLVHVRGSSPSASKVLMKKHPQADVSTLGH